MERSERDELRRAIMRFQELTQPHRLLELLTRHEELEKEFARKREQEQARAEGVLVQDLVQGVRSC